MKHFDCLRSQCGMVELVNVEVAGSRLLCGFAFVEAWTQENVVFNDDRGAYVCAIVLPLQFQNLQAAIAISSPTDDLFFAVRPGGS